MKQIKIVLRYRCIIVLNQWCYNFYRKRVQGRDTRFQGRDGEDTRRNEDKVISRSRINRAENTVRGLADRNDETEQNKIGIINI